MRKLQVILTVFGLAACITIHVDPIPVVLTFKWPGFGMVAPEPDAGLPDAGGLR